MLGVIADCDNFCEIADWAADNLSSLRSDFGLSFPNGIPSEATLERVFKRLKTKELQNCYQSFLGDIALSGKQLCLDGKELRSTTAPGKKHAQVQMVNLWVHEPGLSFAHEQVADKSNEITAIPLLLEQTDISGAVVSIDAMGCQKEIVSAIRAQRADYLIALKGNQGSLFAQANQEFALEKAHLPHYELTEQGHGRDEHRMVWVSDDLKWIENRADWKDHNSLILVERTRTVKGHTTTSTGLYMSSLVNPTSTVLCA